MASNNLATTLEQEKITSNQLAHQCNLNRSTVMSVVRKKRTPAPSTLELMVKHLNRMTKKSYTVEEIFPPKVRRLRSGPQPAR